MFCSKCGARNSADQTFCTSCGSQIQRELSARTTENAQAPTLTDAPKPLHAKRAPNKRKSQRVAAWSAATLIVGFAITTVCFYVSRIRAKADTEAIDRALVLAKQKDYDKENQILRPLAERGVARAQYNLGVSYSRGMGVPQDDIQAAGWFRKAAEQGFVPAQAAICGAYFTGKGLPEDPKQAIPWCQKSAAQGNASSEYILGEAYHWGEGTKKDEAQALAWYSKAAEQGDLDAMTEAGILQVNGGDIPSDTAKGMALILKSAELGNAKAQYTLGQIYFQGVGVEKDYRQAKAWFEKAVDQGYDDARSALPKVYQQEEKERAQAALARMDYPQRYAATTASSFLSGPACDGLKSMMLQVSNSTQTPENIRMAQINSFVDGASRAHCLRE